MKRKKYFLNLGRRKVGGEGREPVSRAVGRKLHGLRGSTGPEILLNSQIIDAGVYILNFASQKYELLAGWWKNMMICLEKSWIWRGGKMGIQRKFSLYLISFLEMGCKNIIFWTNVHPWIDACWSFHQWCGFRIRSDHCFSQWKYLIFEFNQHTKLGPRTQSFNRLYIDEKI